MQNTELISCELVSETEQEQSADTKADEIVLRDVSKPYVESSRREVIVGEHSLYLSTIVVVVPLSPDWSPDMPNVPLSINGFQMLLTLLIILEEDVGIALEQEIVKFFGSTRSLQTFRDILKGLRRLGVLSELWYIQNSNEKEEEVEKKIDELYSHLQFRMLNPDMQEEKVLSDLRQESKKTCAVLSSIGRYLHHKFYLRPDEQKLVKDLVGNHMWRYAFSGPIALLKPSKIYRVFG